jgi:drug/metabolite transporter (DMT)-like permease
VSTSVQSLGLTLQRKSHILEDEKVPHDVRRPPHRRRRWQLGMAMFIISNLVGSTIQITTLPLPVLSTLQASGLVFNSICATLILGEPFTRWSLGGTLLVAGGAVLIAIFGAIGEPAHSLDQLLELLGRQTFIIWMVMQGLLVVTIVAVAGSLQRMHIALTPRIRLFRGLAYGCISGILSAHSLLVAKSAVELVVCTIVDGANQFTRWQSWMIVLGLVFLALTQLYYLNLGLKLVSTSVLYPLIFCVYNIVAILDGLIYFKQIDRLSTLHACLVALGTVVLLSGVLALSWRLSDDQSQPPVPPSALTPGLGFVESSDEEDIIEEELEEEEEPTPVTTTHDEESPLLLRSSTTPVIKHQFSPSISSQTTLLSPGARSARRARFSREAHEIWGELADSTPSPRRSSSLALTSSPLFGTDGTSPLSPGAGPTSPSAGGVPGDADEHTALLPHTRSRSRRRRRSTGFPAFAARPATARPGGNSRGLRRSQSALGGLWRMSSWWRGDGGSTNARRSADGSRDEGPGPSSAT